MKILIVGGGGYIGSALSKRLLEEGWDFQVVDTFWFGNYLPQGVSFKKQDLFHLGKNDLKGFDQLIFLAGLSNDPMAEYSPSQNFIYNTAAVAYLGYMSKSVGVRRLIYGSSCSVYGYTLNQLYDENSPTVSKYPYGLSKLQGEQSLLLMNDDDFSVISLRQGTVSGPSPRMRFDLVVNAMFKTAYRDQMIHVNNPLIWRPILGIQDAVNGYLCALKSDEKVSGVFNVTSNNYTVGQIAEIVKKECEEKYQKQIEVKVEYRQDYRNYQVKIEKAKKILNYNPKQDVKKIVQELMQYGFDSLDLESPKYYNIQIFKKLLN